MSSWLDLCGDDSNLSMASADFDRELKHLSSLSRLSATATRSRSKFDIEFDNSQAGVNLLFKKNVQILDENSKSRKRKIYSINEINEINNDNINLPPKAKQRTNIAGDWKQTKICNKNKNDFSHFLKWVKNEKTNKNTNCNINSNTNSNNNNILRTKSINNNKNNKFFVISNASSSNKLLKSRRIRRKNKKIQKIQINNNDNDNDDDIDIDIDMKENIQNNKENICINQDKKEDIQIQIQIETNSNSSNDLDLDLIKDKDRVPEPEPKPEQVQDKPTEPEPNAVPDAIAVADVDQDEDEDEDLKPTKANDPAPAPVPVLDANPNPNPNPDNDLKKNTPQHQDPDPVPVPEQDKALDADQDENKDPDSISGSGCGSVAGSVTVSVSNSDVDISSQTSSRRSSIKIRRRITPVLSNIIFNSDLMQMKVPILKKQNNNNNDKCGAPVFLNADQYIKLTGNTPKKIENKPIKKQNIIINNQQINHKNNITQQIKNEIKDEIKDEIEDNVSDDIDIDIIASKSASKSTFQSVWGSNSLIDPHSKENQSGNSSWAQKLFSSEIAQNKLKKESESEMLVNIKKTARINDIQIDSILPSVSILSRESSTSIISSSNTNRSSATATATATGVLIDGPPRNQIEWRRKQILIGKSTEGYNNCLNKYPNYNDNNYYKYNNNKLILTPSPQEKIGKKRWIGKLLKWRKFLHQFDNNDHNTSNNDNQ